MGYVLLIATKLKVLKHIKTSKEPVTIAEMPIKINSLMSMSCTCFGSLAKIKAKKGMSYLFPQNPKCYAM